MEKVIHNNKICFSIIATLISCGFVNIISGVSVFADPTPTYTASLSTSGGVAVNVSSAGNGANVSTDTVNVVSTCPSGYTLAIGGPSDATLYLNGNSSATSTISASTGTSSSPVPIIGTGYVNTWGYSTAANTTTNSSFIGLTNAPSIITTTSAASASGGDNISVYYGASVDGSIKPGTYMMAESSAGAGDNAIVYYLTTSQDCVSYMVHFDPTSTASGSSVSGEGTMADQRIYENVATNLTSNGFTTPYGYEFLEWNTAQDGTGTSYADGASVTNLTTVGQTITLYAQWKEVCPSGKICYHENGDNVEGTMGQQTVSSSATSITLLASNYSREGYGFAGWSDVSDYTTNPNAHFYGPQEDIAFTAGQYTSPNNGLDLYAVWVESEGYLQDSSKVASVCGRLTATTASSTPTLSSVSALTDQRDNNTYAIAKLADGKCWMIENLRLEAENTRSDANKALAQGYGTSTTYGNFSGLADAESDNFTNTNPPVANSKYSVDGSDDTTNIGSGSYPYARMPRYNHTNTSDRATSPTADTGAMYSYGNYYTWAATIADTAYYNSNNTSATNTSLCPSGWRLPKGGNNQNTANNEYLAFSEALIGAKPANYDTQTYPYYTGTPEGTDASNALRSFPNNFLYSSSFDVSSAYGMGSYGYYWSSTARNYNYSYSLVLSSSSVTPGSYINNKYYGLSIRCIVAGS